MDSSAVTTPVRSAPRLLGVRQRLALAVLICLPVPVLAGTGLAIPLPSVVYRVAVALAERTHAVVMDIARVGTTAGEARPALLRGTIRLTPAERAALGQEAQAFTRPDVHAEPPHTPRREPALVPASGAPRADVIEPFIPIAAVVPVEAPVPFAAVIPAETGAGATGNTRPDPPATGEGAGEPAAPAPPAPAGGQPPREATAPETTNASAPPDPAGQPTTNSPEPPRTSPEPVFTTSPAEPDTTSPETTILSAPEPITNEVDASFAFSSSEPSSKFECSLDAAPYAECTSPVTHSGLELGSHTFRVRATDSSGNVDPTPATHSWTIVFVAPPDTTAPETTIDSAPSSLSIERDASFTFSSSEAGSTFECALDGAPFAACTSPSSYTGLAVGSHTFAVRASDAAGNVDVTPATHEWFVAAAPVDPGPETTITAAPASETTSTSATFAFESSSPGVTFECSLDGSAYTVCATPVTYDALGVGEHTFGVRARSAGGTADPTPAVHRWTIVEPPDTVAPETTINSAPDDVTSSEDATFSFSSSEAGSTFECSLDDDSFTACSSPITYTGLRNRRHTFAVRATDGSGNTDATPATHAWTINGSRRP
jgi:hypothetical protein